MGLVPLCTPSLCPRSHQLLGLGCSEVPGHSLLRVSGIFGQSLHRMSKTRQFKKKKPSCLAELHHRSTIMSKENVSGTPSHPSKFIAFLQRVEDHLINCSLCTADRGEQVSGVGVGKSEAILVSLLYLTAAICT